MLFVTRLPTSHKIHNWISVGTKNSPAPLIAYNVLRSKGSYAVAFGMSCSFFFSRRVVQRCQG